MDKNKRPKRNAAQRVMTYDMYFNHSSYNEERVLQKALQFSLQEAEAEEKKRSKEQQDNLSNKTSKSKKINTIKKRSIKKTLINERKMSSLKKSIQKSEQDVKIKAKAGAAVVKRPVGRPRIVQNRSPVRDKSASEETETEEEAVDKTEVARTAEDKGEEEPPITYKFTATRKFPCNYSKLGNDDPQQSVEASGSLKGGKKCAKNDDPEGSNDICILGTSDVSTGDFLNFLCFRDVSLLSLNRKRKQEEQLKCPPTNESDDTYESAKEEVSEDDSDTSIEQEEDEELTAKSESKPRSKQRKAESDVSTTKSKVMRSKSKSNGNEMRSIGGLSFSSTSSATSASLNAKRSLRSASK